MRYCEQCGAKVSETAKFCDSCGAKLVTIKTDDQAHIDIKKPGQKKDQPNQAGDMDELDLSALDKKAGAASKPEKGTSSSSAAQKDHDDKTSKQKSGQEPKSGKNIIDLKEILEQEEKVEMDDSIKREVLTDDEVLSKICPMCGEDMQISNKLLENTPALIKCLKCGNVTKIW
jgi:predicted RNA-binding Zn-ribbon protein involved in translation (DUF1610 family)